MLARLWNAAEDVSASSAVKFADILNSNAIFGSAGTLGTVVGGAVVAAAVVTGGVVAGVVVAAAVVTGGVVAGAVVAGAVAAAVVA